MTEWLSLSGYSEESVLGGLFPWLSFIGHAPLYCFCQLMQNSFASLRVGPWSYVWLCLIQATAAAAKSLQLCPTLCNPIDGSPPGSPVPGILQARTLEWVAISFSNAWKWKVKVKSLSCVGLLATPWTVAYQAPLSMGFSRQEYWSGVPLPSLPGHWVNVKEHHPSPCPDTLSLSRLSVLTLQPLSKKTYSGQGLHVFITTGS